MAEQNLIGTDPKFWDDFFQRAEAADKYTKEVVKQYEAKEKQYGHVMDEAVSNLYQTRANDITNTQNFVSGNTMTGPLPINKFTLTTDQYLQKQMDYARNANEWAKDPFALAKPFDYNGSQYGLFFDRYYHHPKYKEFGFSPFRDNEAFYNANSDKWDDWSRMRKVWDNLWWDGATGLFQNWGNYSLAGDRHSAEEMEKNMGIASSSRGGFEGFVTNLAGNSAYTAGVMSEILAEELGLFALSFVPGMQGLAAGRTIKNTTRAVDLLKDFGKIINNMGDLKSMTKSLKSFTTAEKFYNGSMKFGKGVLNFLNPLENTTDFIRGYEKLDDAAKISRGAGAFYRDMRAINATLDEATLEGGFVQNKVSADLLNKYYDEKGFLPDAYSEDAKNIHRTAELAGKTTSAINAGVIFYSNKIVFDKLVRPTNMLLGDLRAQIGTKGFRKVMQDGLPTIVTYTNKTAKKFVDKGYLAELPKSFLRGSVNYAGANLTEGVQELIQEGVAVGAENYYTNMYNNAMVGNQAMVMGAISKGINSQMSHQGLEVFASGFLMGGPFNLIQNQAVGAFDYLKQNVYNSKLFGEKGIERQKKAEAFRKQMDQNAEQLASSMTAAVRNPAAFINLLQENAVNQRNILQLYDQAAAKKDMKTMKDLDAQSVAFHLHTLLSHNKVDILKGQLKDYLKMDDKSLENALDQQINDGSKAPVIREKIQRSLEKVNEYEALDKAFDDKFGTNEYDESSISWHAFNRAKQHFVYNRFALNDKVNRLQNIYSEVAAMQLDGVDQADVTLLLTDISLQHTPNALINEIALLKEEAKALKQGGPQEQKQAEFVNKKIENLKGLRDKLIQREQFYQQAKQREANSTNPQDDLAIAEDKALADKFDLEAQEAFNKYFNDIAQYNGRVVDQDKLDSIFEKVSDYRSNVVDRDVLTRAINILSNPEYFRSFEARLQNIYEKLSANTKQYLEESLKKFFETTFNLRVINELGSAGVFLTPEGIDELGKGIMPTLYAVPTSAGRYGTDVPGSDTPLNELSPTSPNANIQARYRKAMQIIRDYEIVMGTTLAGKKKFRTGEIPVNSDADIIRMSDDKRNLYDFYEELGLDIDKDSEEMSLEEFLEKLATSEYLDYATFEILRALHTTFKGTTDKITISKNLNQPVEYNERTGLSVDLQYFAIDVNPDGKENQMPFERTMAKYIMQVLGQKELKRDKEFADSIQEMLDNTVRWLSVEENKEKAIESGIYPDPGAVYGLSSPEAFVAAAMTDFKFQSMLSKIKSEKAKKKTVWESFLDGIKLIIDKVFESFGFEGSLLDESVELITRKIFTKAKAEPVITTTAPKVKNIKASVKDKTLKTDFPDLYDELYNYVKAIDPNIDDVEQYLIENLDDEYIFNKLKNEMNEITEDYLTTVAILEEAKKAAAAKPKVAGLSDSQLKNRVRRLNYPDADIRAMSREDMSTIVSNKVFYNQFQTKYDNSFAKLRDDFNIPEAELKAMTMAAVISMYETKIREQLETNTEFAVTLEQKETVEDLLTLFERKNYKSFPVDNAGNIVTSEEDIKNSTRKLTFALDAEGNPVGKGFVRTTSLYSKLVEGLDKEKESFGSVHTARGTFADDLLREFLQFNSPVRSKAAFISNAKRKLADLQASSDPADKFFKDLKYSDEFYSNLFDVYTAIRNMALSNNIYIVTDMPRMSGNVMGEDVTGEGDIFAVYPDGRIEIWDLKTAMRSRRVDYAEAKSIYKPKDAIQLNTYSEIVEQKGPRKISGNRILPLEFGQEDDDGVVSDVKIDIDPLSRTESVAKYTIRVERKPVKELVEQYQTKRAKARAAMAEEEEVTPTPPPAVTPTTDGELAKKLYKEMKAGKQITEFTAEEQKIINDPTILTQEIKDSIDKEEIKPVTAVVPEVAKATIELQKLGINTNLMTSEQILERYKSLTEDEAKATEEIQFGVGDTVAVKTGKKGESKIKVDRGTLVLLEDGRQVSKKNITLVSKATVAPPAAPATPAAEEVIPPVTEVAGDREFVTPTGKVIRLNDQQFEAYNTMRTWYNTPGGEPFFVLEGYAGTGKTTIVKKFMDSLSADPNDPFTRGVNIIVSAPTHKARKVISKTTGRESATLHSLLGLRPDLDLNKLSLKDVKFIQEADIKIGTGVDLLVIDESSMINKVLYDLILEIAAQKGIKVLFMGDPAQLPPINETISKVFMNKNKYTLTKVERQAGDNPLMFIYDSIRNNIEASSDKFEHISKVNAAGDGVMFTRSQNFFDDLMLQMFESEEYKNNPDYVKVLAYHNDRVSYYNQKIRNRIFNNPKEPIVEGELLTGYSTVNKGFTEIIANSVDYRVNSVKQATKVIDAADGSSYTFTGLEIEIEEIGAEQPKYETVFIMDHTDAQEKQYDKMMQMAANASERVGGKKTKEGKRILAAYLFGLKNNILLIDDIANREGKVVYPKTFTYGYAMTVHKSQGSTFTNVFVDENDIDALQRPKERNQMKYVALSRPSKMAYVLSKKSLGKTDSGFSPVDEALFSLAGYTKEVTSTADNGNRLVINTLDTTNQLAAQSNEIKPGTILDIVTGEDSIDTAADGVKYAKLQPIRVIINGEEIGEINSYEGQLTNDTENYYNIQRMLDQGRDVKLVVTNVDRVEGEITNISYQIVSSPEPEAARENLIAAVTNRIESTTDKTFLETDESIEGDLISFSIFGEYLVDLLDKQAITKSEYKNFIKMINDKVTTTEVTETPAPVITPENQEEIKNQPVNDDLELDKSLTSEDDVLGGLNDIGIKCNQ